MALKMRHAAREDREREREGKNRRRGRRRKAAKGKWKVEQITEYLRNEGTFNMGAIRAQPTQTLVNSRRD